MMQTVEFFSYTQKESIIEQLEAYDWRAATYLATLLKENRLQNALGGWAKLFLLLDGETLVSFLTLSAQDCISDPALTPWLGFFHTAPRYRGHRYGKILIDRAFQVARESGYQTVFLATDHEGLYEKYGFAYLENRMDIWGTDSRIYRKEVR